ncbi:MAG TPA: hypothetical protein VD905_05420 [Flavobacteriales bacterium]|nr:hypothetical protein [Flavobacteriales bacterium]
MKSILFSACLVSLTNFLHAHTAMDNHDALAPKKYLYIDGNNNRYVMTQVPEGATIEYMPIAAVESSSGLYSGGEPWKITISKDDFNALSDLLVKSTRDVTQLSEERNMGCGTIVLPKNKTFFLRMDAANKTAIENKLKTLKKNYMPKNEDVVANDTLEVLGKIIEKNFVSKKGEVKGFTEFYFVPTQIKDSNYKEDYFVKLSKGKVTRDELKQYVNKEVNIKCVMLRGLWDADDNTHQSRFGDYVIILEVKG